MNCEKRDIMYAGAAKFVEKLTLEVLADVLTYLVTATLVNQTRFHKAMGLLHSDGTAVSSKPGKKHQAHWQDQES